MKAVGLIFPHQLFTENELLENCQVLYLIEEFLFFKQYKFHKQKLAFHRASMKYYEAFLQKKKANIVYIDSQSELSDIKKLLVHLSSKKVKEVHCIEPDDDWLEQRLRKGCEESNLALKTYSSPLFVNTRESIKPFFEKSTLRQTSFYIEQRKKWNILLTDNNKPLCGKWTYDEQNRAKYPKNKTAIEPD